MLDKGEPEPISSRILNFRLKYILYIKFTSLPK